MCFFTVSRRPSAGHHTFPLMSKRARLATPSSDLSASGEGACDQFRLRLALSVLSNKPFRLTEVRTHSESPGLTDDEVAFARLIAALTNGSRVEIDETGTSFSFRPGVLKGGSVSLSLDSNVHMGWLIEGVAPLIPFLGSALSLRLAGGVTEDDAECGSDLLANVTLRLLTRFGLEKPVLTTVVRATRPLGGGELHLSASPVRHQLSMPKGLDQPSLVVARVRGTAFGLRVNPQMVNRVATAARNEVDLYSADVYVATDARGMKSGKTGASPGYGLSLWADCVSPADAEQAYESAFITSLGDSGGAFKDEDTKLVEPPEALGKRVARALLQDIASGSCVDLRHQSLLIVLMASCPQDVVRARLGKELAPHAIGALRLIKEALGVVFKLKATEENDGLMISCVGAGLQNVARTVT